MSEQTHDEDDLGFQLPEASKASRPRVLFFVVITVAALFAIGYWKYHRAQSAVPKPVERTGANTPKVQTTHAKALSSDRALVLPGLVRALEQTAIYPRATGYIRKWNVDIGDKVTAGQVLAEIDTPDLDAQISQARAQVAQAEATVKQLEATRDFSKTNAARYQTLADQKLVAEQTVQQIAAGAQSDAANVTAAQANVTAAQANLRHLTDLQGFARVTAPFAGTITARNIDRGALVTEGTGTVLFTLAATDPVRIFVDVPQTVAPSVLPGTPTELTVREFPGRKFAGKVARSSGALDPALHTMTTEIDVPNPDGALLPGMYVQAGVNLAVPHKVLEIPATALYNDANGLRVAEVTADNKIHFLPITIERDTGATLQISTGVTEQDRILGIAVASLSEGDPVDPEEMKVTASPAAAGSGSAAGSAAGSGSASK
ncbi:MAG TPA: efflux RND transporter periplasmic adaptor subunit [Kofleriaceae bacterium]|jgi:RND family efflux transporter MFP subunit